MRFILVDRIDEVRPAEYARGVLLAGPSMPATLVMEGIAQLGAWLLMASTDFSKRPVLGGIREVVVHRQVPPGSAVTLEAWVDEVSDEAAVMHGVARAGADPVVEVRDLLSAFIPADRLEPVEQTRRTYAWLCRADSP